MIVPASFDVIIVGAGPAGSTLSILLARAGWSVALVEKARFPRRKVCGECVAASNFPLLEALGIGQAIATESGPELQRMALMCGAHISIAELPAAAHEKYAWGRAMSREILDSALLKAARATGVHVLQPSAVQAIDGSIGAWRVDTRNMDTGTRQTLSAPIAVAAHGSWEVLPAERPVRRRQHRPSDLLAFKANFCDSALAAGLLPVLSFKGGYGGMVVAGSGITTLACCIRRDRLEACRRINPGAGAGDVVELMLRRECLGVRAALDGARRVGPWLAAGPIDPGIRLRADNSIFRIGNAAGEAHPIIGEGMSMAIQSAWLLYGLLADDRPGLLANVAWQRKVANSYAAEWRHHFAQRLRIAAAFAHVAMQPSTATLLIALARRWPGLLTTGARIGGKTRSAADPLLVDASYATSANA